MRKLTSAYLFSSLLLLGGLVGVDARSAELEGCLNIHRRPSARMLSLHRPREWCRSPYRLGEANWASAGRVYRQAHNDFLAVPSARRIVLQHSLGVEAAGDDRTRELANQRVPTRDRLDSSRF
jgi:hypothetical protein